MVTFFLVLVALVSPLCALFYYFLIPIPPTMPNSQQIIEVVMPLHLERSFFYLVPPHLSNMATPGRRALVPFGKRTMTAYIVAIVTAVPDYPLKEIHSILDEVPLWSEKELVFFKWVAAYYIASLGDVIKTALPAGINLQSKKRTDGNESITGGQSIKRERYYLPTTSVAPPKSLGNKADEILKVIRELGELSWSDVRRRFGQCQIQLKRLLELTLIRKEEREIYRNPFSDNSVEQDFPRQLNQYQHAALLALQSAVNSKQYAPHLLHGVTGSGKTEVYLQAIAHTLEQGKTAMVLVPEISLTPQLVYRFRARFGDDIAVLHSGLSDGERYDEWRRIRRAEVRIVIGARSAIFAPLGDIGIIVVDEEHEASFKQSDGVRYNARDLALVRGTLEQATVLLGSATPLVTTLFAVEQGRLTILPLPERVADRQMPSVELVHLQGKGEQILSNSLIQGLKSNLESGEQSLVFLNRRGFSTVLVCAECGEPLACPNCSVTLTFHRQRQQSICHYCDYAVPFPSVCQSCDSPQMLESGSGTEKVEHELHERMPEAKIIRMDSDTTSGKDGHSRLLGMMSRREADILVGTQMIAKGHDFPGVTFVGVLDAEASLNMPDFRNSERTFQILSQVFGRAGRGELAGRVILQTRNPEHYAIESAVRHDSKTFYQKELEFRHEAGYPPFRHLACISFSGISEQAVETRAFEMATMLLAIKNRMGLRLEILGPAPAPLYRIRSRYRRQILVKAIMRNDLRRLIGEWLRLHKSVSTIRENVDIDPVDMM